MVKKIAINSFITCFSLIASILLLEILLHVDVIYKLAKSIQGIYHSNSSHSIPDNGDITSKVLDQFRLKFKSLEDFDDSIFKSEHEYTKTFEGSICCQYLDGISFAEPNQKSVEKYENLSINKIIYEASYSTDFAGRRASPAQKEYKGLSNMIFIGGSFTFGQGVNDDETFPHFYSLLSKGPINFYNVSYFGYGINDILYHQETSAKENLFQGIDKSKETTVLYTFIENHAVRATVPLETYISLSHRDHDEDVENWFQNLHEKPWYKSSGHNTSAYVGRFHDRHIINSLYGVLEKSKIVEVTKLSRFLFKYYDIPDYIKVLNSSYKKFEKDYKLKDFYLVIGGEVNDYYAQIINHLDPNIKIIYTGHLDLEILKLLKNNQTFPKDGHPTKYYYEILASIVFSRVNNQ